MASNASATAIILAPSGSCEPLAARPPRLPSYQAGMLSTISRTRRDAQLRRRMLRLILRERAMMAASFSSSVPGFNRISSGAPIMPTSCSNAAISMSSRSSLGQIHLHRPARTRQRHAQRMSGHGRILALQGGKQTGRDSQASLHQPVVDRLAEHRRQHLGWRPSSPPIPLAGHGVPSSSARPTPERLGSPRQGAIAVHGGFRKRCSWVRISKGIIVDTAAAAYPRASGRQFTSRPVIENLGHVWTWVKTEGRPRSTDSMPSEQSERHGELACQRHPPLRVANCVDADGQDRSIRLDCRLPLEVCDNQGWFGTLVTAVVELPATRRAENQTGILRIHPNRHCRAARSLQFVPPRRPARRPPSPAVGRRSLRSGRRFPVPHLVRRRQLAAEVGVLWKRRIPRTTVAIARSGSASAAGVDAVAGGGSRDHRRT